MADVTTCINDVCTASANAEAAITNLTTDLVAAGTSLDCILNGAVGTFCTLPDLTVVPSVQEKLAGVSSETITDVETELFTATGGETSVTVTTAPGTDERIEVSINGVVQIYTVDFTVAGTAINLTHALEADDNVQTMNFIV